MTRIEMLEHNKLLSETQRKRLVLVFKKIPLSLGQSEFLSLNFIMSLIAGFLLLPHTFIPNDIKVVMAFYVAIIQLIWWNTKVIIYPFLDETDYYLKDLLIHRKLNIPVVVSKKEDGLYCVYEYHPEKKLKEKLSYQEVSETYYFVMPNSNEYESIKGVLND